MLFATAGLSFGSSFGCFPFFPFRTGKLVAGGAFSLSFSHGISDKTGMSVVKGTVTGRGNLSVSLMPRPVEEPGPVVSGTCSGEDSGVVLVGAV